MRNLQKENQRLRSEVRRMQAELARNERLVRRIAILGLIARPTTAPSKENRQNEDAQSLMSELDEMRIQSQSQQQEVALLREKNRELKVMIKNSKNAIEKHFFGSGSCDRW